VSLDGISLYASSSSVPANFAYRRHWRAAERGYLEDLERREAELGKDHPFLVDPLVGLAECHLRRGESAAASRKLERALALCETDPPEELAYVRFLTARALWAEGKARQRAIELARLARDALARFRQGAVITGAMGLPITRAEAAAQLRRVEAWLDARQRGPIPGAPDAKSGQCRQLAALAQLQA